MDALFERGSEEYIKHLEDVVDEYTNQVKLEAAKIREQAEISVRHRLYWNIESLAQQGRRLKRERNFWIAIGVINLINSILLPIIVFLILR
jgi:hypothetical protein